MHDAQFPRPFELEIDLLRICCNYSGPINSSRTSFTLRSRKSFTRSSSSRIIIAFMGSNLQRHNELAQMQNLLLTIAFLHPSYPSCTLFHWTCCKSSKACCRPNDSRVTDFLLPLVRILFIVYRLLVLESLCITFYFCLPYGICIDNCDFYFTPIVSRFHALVNVSR